MIVALSLFLLALCGYGQSLVLSGGVSFQAGANVTLASPDSRFDYRQTSFIDVAGLLVYTSIQATGQTGQNSGNVNANGIVGVAYSKTILTPFVTIPPTLYVCFFNASGSVTSFANSMNADVSASLSFVGKTYHLLEEVDASGAVVKTTNLGDVALSSSGVKTADAAKGLRYVTLTGTSSGATIALTYAVSSVLGKLADGGATITPTSIESFFEVDNYVYANTANKLRLTIYLGILSAKASVSKTTTITAGSGAEEVYVRLDATAIVNGETKSVTVSGVGQKNVQISDVPSTQLRGQLSGHGDYQAEVNKIVVEFPAGATSFTYDPAVGFGAPNSAGILKPTFFLLAIIAALLCLF